MVTEQFGLVIGVDSHRDTHTVVVLNQVGRELKTWTVAATAAGHEELREVDRRHGLACLVSPPSPA